MPSKEQKLNIFYIVLLLMYCLAFISKKLAFHLHIPFAILGSGILIVSVIISCIFFRTAILGLGAGAISGFFMFPLEKIKSYMAQNGSEISTYPDFLTELLPLSLIFSFCGLFILFNVLRVSHALESLVVYIARIGLRGRRSAKFISFLLGLMFYTGGTTSSAAVSAVMRDIALKYISPEELAAIVDMTAAPVALIFQKFSYWGTLLTGLIISADVPFLANLELTKVFLNKLVLTVFILPNFLILLAALLLALDLYPSFLLSKMFKDIINKKKVSAEKTTQEEILNKPQPYLAFVSASSLALLFIVSGIRDFKTSLLIAICYSIIMLFNIFKDREKGAKRLIDAIEGGIFEATPILLILYLAGFISIFLKMTGLPGYLAHSVAGNIPHIWLPLIINILTFGIAYASGTSFGTYKIMFAFVPSLAYEVAMYSGFSPEQTFTYLQIVIGGVLVTSVQADLSSFVSDTTIVAARGSRCSVISHFLTQMPIVAQIVVFTLIFYTVLAMNL